jgi:RimJ/RimL family protein N-acetyltransferase
MILTTRRLLLREFVEHDWKAVMGYQSMPQYTRYYPWTVRMEADVRVLVQRFIDWQYEQPRTRFQFAIVPHPAHEELDNQACYDQHSNGQWIIGSCGLRMKQKYHQREAELGYEIASEYWHQGYATEAAYALLNLGFEQLHLERVYAVCIADNRASIRVMEKLGMYRNNGFRERCWMKGRWWNRLAYTIRAEEWQAVGE